MKPELAGSPWHHTTGSERASSNTWGACAKIRMSPTAAGSGLFRPCSQFCRVRTSMPSKSAYSRCDRPCRARKAATVSPLSAKDRRRRSCTFIVRSSRANAGRSSVNATAHTVQPNSASLLMALCASLSVRPAANNLRATVTGLSSGPVRRNTTTVEASEVKDGRDTSRTGPRRSKRAFNSEFVDIKVFLGPSIRSRSTRVPSIFGPAPWMCRPRNTARRRPKSTSAITSIWWLPSASVTENRIDVAEIKVQNAPRHIRLQAGVSNCPDAATTLIYANHVVAST